MEQIPYKCHILVCVNDREGKSQSCAGSGSMEIRNQLKDAISQMGWDKTTVRVSQSLCQGMCSTGPNVMIYPQNILFSHTTVDDVPRILEKIKEIVNT